MHDVTGRIEVSHSGQHTEGKMMQPQTEEQRGKQACALSARGAISKVMQGTRGGAAASTAEHRKQWTTALIPRVRTPQKRHGLKQRVCSMHGEEAGTRKPDVL